MAPMKLICHPLTAEDPPIRPAEPRRQWMDDTPESFAYRCLPLAVEQAADTVQLSKV